MTLEEKIATLKLEYPTIRIGDDERGYTDFSPVEYEATIKQWAINQLADENAVSKAEADKAALLAKLGISADEAKLLLS